MHLGARVSAEFIMRAESIFDPAAFSQLIYQHRNSNTSFYSNCLSKMISMQGSGSHKTRLRQENIVDDFMHHLIQTWKPIAI
jgi:hypothetical protein